MKNKKKWKIPTKSMIKNKNNFGDFYFTFNVKKILDFTNRLIRRRRANRGFSWCERSKQLNSVVYAKKYKKFTEK